MITLQRHLPMKKISTQLLTISTESKMAPQTASRQSDSAAHPGPRKSTLDLIRQFAHSYSAEPRLSVPGLSGLLLN